MSALSNHIRRLSGQQQTAQKNALSHELRTPLAIIAGYARMLEEETSGQYDHLIAPMQEATERLTRVVDQVLEFESHNRTSSAQRTNEPAEDSPAPQSDVSSVGSRIPIEHLVRRLIHKTAHRHDETDVTVSLDIEAGLSLTVDHADFFAGALEPVLDNAIRFTRKGQVRIKARISDQDLVIRILDQGPGLPEGSVSLFAPFLQGSTGLNRAHQGLGLGLFNAKSAIGKLDGSIKLRSLEGQAGTMVTLTIPAALVSSSSVPGTGKSLTPVDLKAVKHVDSDAEYTPVRRAA